MMTKRISMVPVLVLSLLVAGSARVWAQNCGRFCQTCAGNPNRWEGYFFDPASTYNMTCTTLSATCQRCMLSVTDDSHSAADIAAMLQSAPLGKLDKLVTEYGDRLLLNPSRNVVAVLGNACNAQAVESVLFLRAEKSRTLEQLGVRSLEEFLERQSNQLAGVPRPEDMHGHR